MKKRIVMLLTVVALMVAMAVGPASAQTITASGELFIMMPTGGDHHSMTTMGGDHFMMMPMS
jgi:hypothetical protein